MVWRERFTALAEQVASIQRIANGGVTPATPGTPGDGGSTSAGTDGAVAAQAESYFRLSVERDGTYTVEYSDNVERIEVRVCVCEGCVCVCARVLILNIFIVTIVSRKEVLAQMLC